MPKKILSKEALVDVKINDLDLVSELLDTHQLETDIGGVTPGKVTGLQLKDALMSEVPADTIRVEPGVGSDVTGDGTPQKPYDTYDFAMSTLSPGGLKLIATEGTGIIDQSLNVTRDQTFVIAPGIVFVPSSGDAINVNSPGSSTIGFNVNSPGSSTIGFRVGGASAISGNAINIVSADGIAADIPIIGGDIVASTGVHSISTLSFNGDVTGPGLVYINAIGGSSTASLDSASLFGRVKDRWYGSMIFYGAVRNRRSSILEVSSGITVSELHVGRELICTNGGGISIGLPEQSTLPTPVGWGFYATRTAAGSVAFTPEGSDTVTGNSSLPSIGSRAYVCRTSLTNWSVGQ